LKSDHIKLMITLTGDNIKRLPLYTDNLLFLDDQYSYIFDNNKFIQKQELFKKFFENIIFIFICEKDFLKYIKENILKMN
jgi:hypothetical protein